MKFSVSSSALLTRLQNVGKVIAPKNSLPILDCFLFNIEENKLTVRAANTEMSLITGLDLIESDGNILLAVPSRIIVDVLRELPDQPVTFDVNENTLGVVLGYQNGNYKFVAQNGAEFPRMKDLEEGFSELKMPADAFLSGISKTIFATADDDLRPIMNSILLDISTDDITFVASDAHKLVRVRNSTIKGDKAASVLIPKKPASIIKNLLPSVDGDVTLSFDSKNISLQLGDYFMVSLLQEGKFPNYNGAIPKDNPYNVTVDRISFLNALKRVSISPNEGVVKLGVSENKIDLRTEDLEFSTSAEESLECQSDGVSLNIGFKAEFLINIISNFNVSTINMKFADPSRAVLFLPVDGNEGEDILMLLMPLLLQ